ncbi:hypothetical protein [Phreatobacter stygius]|uniref:Uncharacterized protein n=1 Tax=Phreatobacter stygius TaxID=1940610 RepID=A0A4D7BGY1_9HYPH|nr:hypothetical protein [Phreatobacter stygius]QCI67122.1 hypothetical protein E8M01_24520 [Phreatobacter stygius]
MTTTNKPGECSIATVERQLTAVVKAMVPMSEIPEALRRQPPIVLPLPQTITETSLNLRFSKILHQVLAQQKTIDRLGKNRARAMIPPHPQQGEQRLPG